MTGTRNGANFLPNNPAKTVYENEINSSPSVNNKIGLMYASDYGFAAAPSAWTSNMSSYNSSSTKSVNWMYMGLNEWTITPISSDSGNVFTLGGDGYLNFNYAGYGYGGRPVLYLKASVAYAGGSGTKDSPITLVV